MALLAPEPMPQTSPLINVMIAAARKAGRALARDFGEVENLQVSRKGPADFVSSADLKAEKTLFEELSKARPGYGFLMEERGEVEGTDKTNRFIVDPLDGTTNFLHSIPHFAISVALEREGAIVAGLVYNPVSEDLFVAEKGKGAFLNDHRIRVAGRKLLADSVVACGLPHIGRGNIELGHKETGVVQRQVAGLRRFGAAALDLAWVAAGRVDAYWERDIQPWDMGAGILLVREAGGYVSDCDGGDEMFATGHILAGNESISRELLRVLKAVKA